MTFVLHQGDCREVMKAMPDASVDSIVCDPPYELGFMGKGWDSTGIANDVTVWREALRVLKPGGHLLAFSGSRTYHRMVCTIEDAGFEVRDQMMWIYGSGFPKSLDVSKAIDRAGGASPIEQARILRHKREAAGLSRDDLAGQVGCTSSSIRDWEEGRARAAGGTVEFIVPSDEYRAKLANFLGYSADERRVIGASGDRRDDGTVYGVGHSGQLRAGGNTVAAHQWQGWGTALKPAHEPICVARKPLIGTVVANVLAHGTGALNIDGCRIEAEAMRPNTGKGALPRRYEGDERESSTPGQPHDLGRWPANVIHDGSAEVLAAFPTTTSGMMKGGTVRAAQDEPGSVCYGTFGGDASVSDTYGDTGSAARFFYCAKASKEDRNEGCSGLPVKTGGMVSNTSGQHITRRDGGAPGPTANHHPTVKPTDLMAYLCRLVTPPGGTVLDPFMGSGSTGKAAVLEGFNFIGIDLSPEYLEIARARIEHTQRQGHQPSLLEQAA